MCTTNNNKKAKKKYTHPPLEDSSKLEDFTCLEYSEHLIDYEGNIGYSNEGFPVEVVYVDFGNGENMFLPINNYEVNIKLENFCDQTSLTIRATNLATGECKTVTQSRINRDAQQSYPSQFLPTKRETNQKHPMNHLQSYHEPIGNQFYMLDLSSYDEPKITSSVESESYLGLSLTGIGAVAGGVEMRLAEKLRPFRPIWDNNGGLFKKGTVARNITTKSLMTGSRYLQTLRGALYWTGVGAGVAGGAFSIYSYTQGEISEERLALDLIMTGVGFAGPIGLVISASYFLLTSPIQIRSTPDFITDPMSDYNRSFKRDNTRLVNPFIH